MLLVALAAAGTGGGRAGPTWEFHVSTRFSSSVVYCHAAPAREVCFKHAKCLPILPVDSACVENEVNDLGGVVGVGTLASQNLVLCLSHCDDEGATVAEVKHGVGFGDYFYLLEPRLGLRLGSVRVEVKAGGSVRVDTSTKFTWVNRETFAGLKSAVALHCQERGCPGRLTFSDPAALACFRVDGSLWDFPTLSFSLTEGRLHAVLPGDYFYEAEDGSRCIGIFESPSDTVIGMNLLAGRRMVADFGNHQLQLGDEVVISALDEDTALSLVSNWIVFVLWGMLCLVIGFKFGQWFAFKWRKLPCYKLPTSYRKRRVLSSRKITFVLPNDPIAAAAVSAESPPPPQKHHNDDHDGDDDGEEASLII